MKTLLTRLVTLAILACGSLHAGTRLRDFDLRGKIDGENISFELKLAFADLPRGGTLELLRGDVALLDYQLPKGLELRREGDRFCAVHTGGFWSPRSGAVKLAFAARNAAEGDWRHTRFAVPVLPVRRVDVEADRADLEVRFPAGRDVRREPTPAGQMVSSASLGLDEWVDVYWKPEIKRVESELVTTCDINTIATASPGTLRLDSVFAYRIAQGQMTEVTLAMPDVNILQVTGADIQDWRIDRSDAAMPRLRVQLGRPQQGEYSLQVEYEHALPAFPCEVPLPVLAPQGVIRAGGGLLLGTDSAVKLQVANATGLTQVDQAAFARVASLRNDRVRAVPARSVFTYQYASVPYTMTVNADNIATAISADFGLLVNVAEGQVTLDASIQLDVRDAPAREVKLVTDADPRWTIVGVTGQMVAESDVDIRTVDGRREIVVPFRQPVEGQALLNLRMELPLATARDLFAVPSVTLFEARSQRGYLVAAAERGIRLVPRDVAELRDVHTASTPFRAEGAQLAYRFREPGWKLALGLEWAQSAIYSELFHLISLGEGVVYVSAAVSCHISGAPVQTLRFRVPDAGENMEVVGVGVDNWSRSNDVCTVQLANRAMGDFTLLISYDQPLDYGAANLPVGGIETLGTASEIGFIAVATSANLRIEETNGLPATLIRIPRDELPAGYAATVTAPVIGAYKYTRRLHATTLRVSALETRRPIEQVVDFLSLSSRIGRDGESVTHATYYVKNAARQYLEAKLPPGASLWTVRQLTDGVGRDLAAQQAADRLLIPVERPRDPNQAVIVEIAYAQSAPNARRRSLASVRLGAPLLLDAPVTFANWQVTADDNRAIGRAGGNLTPAEGSPTGFPMARRHRATTRSFYRTAHLAGEPPMELRLTLVPRWLAGGSLRLLFGAGLAGLLVLGYAVVRRSRFALAVALTLLGLAAMQTWPGVQAVMALAVAAVPIAIVAAIVRGYLALARRRRARRNDLSAPLVTDAAGAPLIDTGRDGAAGIRALLLATALATGLAAVLRADDTPPGDAPPPPAPLAVQRLEAAIEAPSTDPLAEPSAVVTWSVRFRVAKPGRFLLFPRSTVLTGKQLDSDDLRLVALPEGLALQVDDTDEHRATFTCRERVMERDGRWSLSLPWLSNLVNKLTLVIPVADMDVEAPQAASLRVTSADGVTRASAAIEPAGRVEIAWRPRARDTRTEAPVVYVDLATVAKLRPGVVDLVSRADFNIVQGETREFRLLVPAGVTVTAVSAPTLATWRFDPVTRRVEAVLARPASGSVTVTLNLQAPCAGLPYDITLGVLTAEGVQRQRGRLGLAAPESILLRVGETAGVAPIDATDFTLDEAPAAPMAATRDAKAVQRPPAADPVRRAFRYDDPATVLVGLHAEAVQPELRVVESSSFSIGDERNVLSAALEIAIAKSGVFALNLDIPDGYEIETLTGRDVSHWDDARRGEQGVEVFLRRRVQDTTPLNLVLSRQQRGIDEVLDVPRVTVRGAARHTGRVAVSAERGVKLVVDRQDGVTSRRPDGEKVQPGVLSFDLLRPDWQVTLRAQVLAPILKPEMLHRVDLAEGMLQHRIHLRYRIENAGVKLFRVRVPSADAPLTVTGRNIARVRPIVDASTNGNGRVWEIELHGKAEDLYAFTAQYQEPFDAAGGGVTIAPFETLGAARQSGFLVVTGGGRVQVQPKGEPQGLKVEDARTLPDTFGAGDLSHAILCYRTLRSDYRLDLSIVRHAAAAVLPASVEQVRLVTLVSGSGRLLTQAELDLKVGDLRFLKMLPPSPRCELWTALVNGTEVAVSRDGETLNIPLEGVAADQRTTVTLVYADALAGGSLTGRHELRAPRFPDLPLSDIRWRCFVPPEFLCRFQDGDLDAEPVMPLVRTFGKSDYEFANKQVQDDNLSAARGNLKALDTLLSSGKQMEARSVLQQAVNLSQAEQTLNEDARVQFRNVVQQQVKMGLVNRREALRTSNNIYDESAPQTQAGWNEGNFSAQYVQQVEEQLNAQDRAGLDLVAQKIVEQQAAAAGVATAIQIAMPEHGREFRFRRALQNERGGELRLPFTVREPRASAKLLTLWPILPAGLALWALLWLLFGASGAAKRSGQ